MTQIAETKYILHHVHESQRNKAFWSVTSKSQDKYVKYFTSTQQCCTKTLFFLKFDIFDKSSRIHSGFETSHTTYSSTISENNTLCHTPGAWIGVLFYIGCVLPARPRRSRSHGRPSVFPRWGYLRAKDAMALQIVNREHHHVYLVCQSWWWL